MIQEISGFVIVVIFTIGIMLLLLMNVIKKNYEILQTANNEITVEVEEPALSLEKKLVYPFYVTVSNSIDKLSTPTATSIEEEAVAQ